MHDTFTPEDRIQNIIYVIKELDQLMHDGDTSFSSIYQEQIKKQFLNLDKAITDMEQSK